MIDRKTPERIATVNAAIIQASAELEDLLLQLASQADARFCAEAYSFIIQHARPGRNRHTNADYVKAHETAVAAATASVNIRDLANRCSTLRQQCRSWQPDSLQVEADIRAVCAELPEPKQ